MCHPRVGDNTLLITGGPIIDILTLSGMLSHSKFLPVGLSFYTFTILVLSVSSDQFTDYVDTFIQVTMKINLLISSCYSKSKGEWFGFF